jgi:hypothetical protein
VAPDNRGLDDMQVTRSRAIKFTIELNEAEAKALSEEARMVGTPPGFAELISLIRQAHYAHTGEPL